MTILCIDTSQATAISLVDAGRVVGRAVHDSPRHHAENISPLVRQVLHQAGLPEVVSEAGLTAIVVGTGPAPFTGLRAGLISARVTGEAVGVPVYGVSSLDMIARQALDLLPPDTEVIAVSDARRREIYWARYQALGPDDVQRLSGPDVGTAEDMLASLGRTAASLRIVCSGGLPAHSAQTLAVVPAGPTVSLDPAVGARIAAVRVARREDEAAAATSGDNAEAGAQVELGTEPLYLRRPEIHGQPMERM